MVSVKKYQHFYHLRITCAAQKLKLTRLHTLESPLYSKLSSEIQLRMDNTSLSYQQKLVHYKKKYRFLLAFGLFEGK